MGTNTQELFVSTKNAEYLGNLTCNDVFVPSAIEYFKSLGQFATIFVSLGAIFMALTLFLAVSGTYKIMVMKETKSVKKHITFILFVYPIASLCSLVALAVPRTQVLSEAVTQIYLTTALYRLYQLLLEIGRREMNKPASLKLRVGPCCCWPCLPFPDLEMNPTNLSWLQVIVLQLPIVQTLLYCALGFVAAEDAALPSRYGIFLQPLSIASILFALYGLAITTASLHEVNPGINITHKATVLQLVLFFTKLQGLIIKALSGTGLFPCNPPITPQIYCNFTYNALMLIEMVFLCYAARHVYVYAQEDTDLEAPAQNQGNRSAPNEIRLRIETPDKPQGGSNPPRNNNEGELRATDPASASP
ncbi:organic solute transporter alpha-like protein 3 [Venturia canescens]|uniref:organic solute transporter alpha-like protein 3 n=1 Tax=Venturia canescens TaxID=32260 RepID=UPI001C9D38CA|nr:organic solute transporter alpha-like protein 3 [Venturia canescens]